MPALTYIKTSPVLTDPESSDRNYKETLPEAALSRLWNNEYDLLLENVSEGVILFDLVDRVRVINSKAAKLLGLGDTFKPFEDITLQDLAKSAKIDIEELINRAKLSHRNHLKELLFSNKRTSVCEVEIRTLTYNGKIPVGTLCFLRDISKQWNENRKKTEFLSMVVHELFNPLTPVREGLGLLLDENIGPLNSVQKQCAGVVYEEINRLSRLVNDLLDINRLDAGKIKIQRNAIDIHPLIETVMSTIENKAEEKNISILVNIPQPIFDLYADRDRIKQVLINLLDNAVKYSPSGSSIEISALSRSGSIEIEVKDHGFGITKSDIKKLFERFAQLSYPEHIESRERGSGLGLSIVKEIVKLHHGKIKVQSDYGKGSTFTVILPKRKKARSYVS